MKQIYLALLLASGLVSAQVFDTTQILNNGDSSKRINLVILGDGYTTNQQATFVTDATKVSDYLFSKEPYKSYKNYFNVYAVKVISAESGVKHPATATDVAEPVIPKSDPNNYFGVSFDIGGTHRCIYTNNLNKVTQVLSANLPDYDMALVIGNSTEYGGCGGSIAILSSNTQAPDVALHELGHSFGKLADEYWFSGSGESPNKTQTSDPKTVKWKNWIGTDNVGVYPYEESPTWFRPHQSCEMRYLNQKFCRVCQETLIEKIHSTQNPIDSYTPANASAINSTSSMNFNVKLILPIPNTLNSTWKLNGVNVGTDSGSLTITDAQLKTGNNQLLYSVIDKTTNVQVDNHDTTHVSTIIWSINKTGLGVDNISSRQLDFVIYPNPSSDNIFIESKNADLGDLQADIIDGSGRLIAKQNLKKSNQYKIDISKLSSQTYTLNVYKDKVLIVSKKIIKE